MIAFSGLLHSSYLNSYVNLVIFASNINCNILHGLIGNKTKELAYIFCVIPCQELIFDCILYVVTNDNFIANLKQYQSTKVDEF
uniref:Uncharacterized protein n=1 Tax=Physcomitrium patens TaxID=3218 RepID=A0A2K1JGB9_PHYPA|nr:hypothetical protein PHYPA_018003 [Physcomitrium patens]